MCEHADGTGVRAPLPYSLSGHRLSRSLLLYLTLSGFQRSAVCRLLQNLQFIKYFHLFSFIYLHTLFSFFVFFFFIFFLLWPLPNLPLPLPIPGPPAPLFFPYPFPFSKRSHAVLLDCSSPVVPKAPLPARLPVQSPGIP